MIWKDVKNYEGRYKISEYGQIKRFDGFEVGQWQSNSGYMKCKLSEPRAEFFVHRLVADVFCEKEKGKNVVNHKDFCTTNNHFSNLEWCNQSYNVSYSREKGRYKDNYWKNKRSPNAKLDDKTVFLIREEYKKGGISQEKLGKKYSCSKRTVNRIVNNIAYKPLPTPPKEV